MIKRQRNRSEFGAALLASTAGLAWGACLMSPAPAVAQEVGLNVIEEVVVTARRREEYLQDTPVAVTALTPAALERRQIFTTDDLDNVTPSLEFTSYGPLTGNNSAAQVFIRGIGQIDATSAVDPGVGMYVDDVYMGRAVGGAMEFRDIGGVQVLRGPQGTLFGRNTIGGAVLLSSVAPGDEFGGTVKLQTGTDNLLQAFGAVDIPLSDTLRSRVSMGVKKRDGYVTRVIDGVKLGDDNTATVKGTVVWDASPDLTVTLRGDFTDEDENGSPFVFEQINETAVFPAAVSVGAGCPGATFPPPFVPGDIVDERCANNATWNLGHYTNGGSADVTSTTRTWGLSGHIDYIVNDMISLKSITAYRELRWTGVRDADNTPFDILTTDLFSDSNQFSQEFQAAVEADRLHGVVGAFYFDESTFDQTDVFISPPLPSVLAGGVGSRDLQFIYLDNTNWALFTQWTYDVTDALSVTGGIRYTHEKKSMQAIITNINPWTDPNPDPLPMTIADGLFILPDKFTNKFEAVTGTISAQYRWSDQLMTYASWSQGFKSGGFNERYNAPTPGNLPIQFDEEKADTYELGFKADPTGTLRLNGALFRTTYDDIQQIYRLGIVNLLFNGGKARIQGAELEFAFVPTEDLIIEGGGSYLDDQIKSVTPIPGTTATITPDNALPFTPKWKLNAGIGYTLHASDSLTITPRVDGTYTSSYFFDAGNTAEVMYESTLVMDASISIENPQQLWKLTFGVQNLTDKDYRLAGNASLTTATGYAEVIYARKRNWFLSLSADF